MRAACHQLPEAVTAALREVAKATAHRMLEGAKERLRAQMKTDRTALIDAMVIEEDAANHAFRVISKPPPGAPPNLPLWNEYGASRHIVGRHYMHGSAAAEVDQYHRDMEAASVGAVTKVLG